MNVKKNDFILIGILLLVALGIFAGYRLIAGQGAGGTVLITVDGKEYARKSLSDEGVYLICPPLALEKLKEEEIPTRNADMDYNLLVIKDGRANVVKASCPDLLCVHQAAIAHTGEQIVCLPNKVVIEIVNGTAPSVDVVTN